MAQTVYLNGCYLPADRAAIHPLDRGFLFADGVYEVVRYYGGRPFAMAEHLERLRYSLGEVRITLPADLPSFDQVSDVLIERNATPEAYVYWQVTRGTTTTRDHAFPDPAVSATTFAFVKPMAPLARSGSPKPMTAVTHPETRWTRCVIKSVALLPNVLARQAAKDAGCDEAIFVRDDGTVTEGTARSIFAVVGGTVRTHPLDGSILGSITRKAALDIANAAVLPVDTRAVSRDELLAADEVFAVGTTTEVRPVTRIDDQPINGGETGPVTRRLAEGLRTRIIRECGL